MVLDGGDPNPAGVIAFNIGTSTKQDKHRWNGIQCMAQAVLCISSRSPLAREKKAGSHPAAEPSCCKPTRRMPFCRVSPKKPHLVRLERRRERPSGSFRLAADKAWWHITRSSAICAGDVRILAILELMRLASFVAAVQQSLVVLWTNKPSRTVCPLPFLPLQSHSRPS